jgi:CelD/BcsL family acetyltransferase involved in cellulose biosynthesis
LAQQQVCTFAQTLPVAEHGLSIDVISDRNEFLASQGEWDRLVEEAGVCHPFMSHAWLKTWWEAFGADNDLRIFVVKANSEWIAVAPMMIRKTTMYGVRVRRLEALYNPHTTRYDFPIRERHDEVVRALWKAFSKASEPWDAVVLQQFPSTSPILDAMESLAKQSGWRTGRWPGPSAPFVELGCDFTGLLRRLKKKERHNLRRCYNNLASIDEIRLEVISDHSQVAAAMKDGLRIESLGWKGTAGSAMASDPRVEQFYLGLAERSAQLGWLKLAFLRVGRKLIAFLYMLDVGGVLYAMKVGYDPEYRNYSPGQLLLMLVLKQACEEGRREFDFQGEKERWKLVWTRDSRPHPWLFMFKDRLRSRLLHHAKFALLPAIRRMPPITDGIPVADLSCGVLDPTK